MNFDSRQTWKACLGALVLSVGLYPLGAQAADREAAKQVRAAIEAYESGDYEKAQAEFTEAELKCPECPEIAYNRGLASYRQRDFAAARAFFNSALQTRDLSLESKTKYNLGNVAYSEALEKVSNLKEAIESARSAIFHYRDALEVNPKDTDARANIEIAQLLIKDLLDKQKQEQEKQNQQNDQNQQNQDQQNQEKQEGDKGEDQQDQDGQQDQEQQKQDGEQGEDKKEQQSEEEQSKDQQGQENKDNQNNDQQNPSQPNDQQQTPQNQQQQSAQMQERKLTPEELANMLQAVRDKEAQRREENKRRMRIRQAPVQKDW